MQTTQSTCHTVLLDRPGLITVVCVEAFRVCCYQCWARRYSRWFNGAPHVLSDPSQLTWCASSLAFSYSASLDILSGLVVCPVAFPCRNRSPLSAWQLFKQRLASGVLEHDCTQSPSCQCENKAPGAQTVMPVRLKPTMCLQISLKLRLSLCFDLPFLQLCISLLCVSFSL